MQLTEAALDHAATGQRKPGAQIRARALTNLELQLLKVLPDEVAAVRRAGVAGYQEETKLRVAVLEDCPALIVQAIGTLPARVRVALAVGEGCELRCSGCVHIHVLI